MRVLWVLEGLFWCAYKGAKAVLLRLPKRKRSWMENFFGFGGKMIAKNGRNIWNEQTTLPRGGKSHHRTDLIVEWNRLKPQRGAKLFCFFAFLTFLSGLLAGYVVFS